MTSAALHDWRTGAAARLDELEQIHRDARGLGPGRRWRTEQLNRSLFVILLAQFQGFCRGLHDEAIDVHVREANPRQASVLRTLLTTNRQLDNKNPRAGAIGSDFGRLGFQLIPVIRQAGPRQVTALNRLETLVEFRNAVSHGNETKAQGITATHEIASNLTSYRVHRRSLDLLASTMDRVVALRLSAGLGIASPW